MINQIYRLSEPKLIKLDFEDRTLNENQIIVRPTHLSICGADQRYYAGKRKKEVLDKKLPLSLIHEAIGKVVHDPTKKFKKGDKVVLIPNFPGKKDDIIKENYNFDSKFRASSMDGFMKNLVFINRDRVIKYDDKLDEVAVLFELLSVGMNALEFFQKRSHKNVNSIGIWGNGSLGFVNALILKKVYPDTKIYLFGPDNSKSSYFTFCDEIYSITDIPDDLRIDHAFECVGGANSAAAINQIIDHINPQGSIALLGVSEEFVPINTRMVLEKGLILIGNSRSGYEDFEMAVKFVEENEDVQMYLKTIISEIIDIKNITDIYKAFDSDGTNEFKTIMNWEM